MALKGDLVVPVPPLPSCLPENFKSIPSLDARAAPAKPTVLHMDAPPDDAQLINANFLKQRLLICNRN